MMCTNNVIFLILCCMLCDKFVILLFYISLSKKNLYGAYVKWLLYSLVNKSSMSMYGIIHGKGFKCIKGVRFV